MELRIKEIIYSTNPVVKAEWIFEEGEQDVEILFDDLQTELLDSVDCYDKTYSTNTVRVPCIHVMNSNIWKK